MMNRLKSGFSFPINSWLRTDLQDLLSEFLNIEALGKSGLFDVDFVLEEVEKFK